MCGVCRNEPVSLLRLHTRFGEEHSPKCQPILNLALMHAFELVNKVCAPPSEINLMDVDYVKLITVD